MGKYDRYSIPEHMSFEPDVVKRDIAELERIEALGKLSRDGYAELPLLKHYQQYQKEKAEKESSPDASA